MRKIKIVHDSKIVHTNQKSYPYLHKLFLSIYGEKLGRRLYEVFMRASDDSRYDTNFPYIYDVQKNRYSEGHIVYKFFRNIFVFGTVPVDDPFAANQGDAYYKFADKWEKYVKTQLFKDSRRFEQIALDIKKYLKEGRNFKR